MSKRNIITYFIGLCLLFCSLCGYGQGTAKNSDTKPVQPNAQQAPIDMKEIELRMMMVDAMLELNQAMLEGVKASIDTLNLPENELAPKTKDMQTSLIRMKRLRDKTLLMPYLEHIQDSLRTEIKALTAERKNLEKTIHPLAEIKPVVLKPDTLFALNDTQSSQISTITPNTQPDNNTVVINTDNEPKPEAKKSDKRKKKNKDFYVSDTILVYDIGTMQPEPEIAPPVSKINYADTSILSRPADDTSYALKIKLPNSNDSLVIKPIKNKNKTKAELPVVIIGDTLPEKTTESIADLSPTAIPEDSLPIIKAQFFLKRAQRAITDKNYKNASQYLEKSIELNPSYYDAWFAKAELDATNGSETDALKEYETCLKLDSTQAQVYYGLGNLYNKTKRKTEAHQAYDKAIKLNPGYVDALMARAMLFRDMKRYLEAIIDYNKVVKAEITYYKAYRERGICRIAIKDYENAADDFTRFLIFEPNNGEIYYYRGMARIAVNELMDGCLDLSTALEKGYKDAEKAIKKNCE
jgi:tetratricopeptide (TPR) repeat protein